MMRLGAKLLLALAGLVAVTSPGEAATGVYNRPATARTPDFAVEPGWPQRLPHDWLLGQVGGLTVDRHDHIWVYNRARTLTNDEAGLEDAVPGAKTAAGVPVNGLGFERAHGPAANCCKAAPAVLEFNAQGRLLRSWGGPADPGFIGGKCKAEAGCIWPASEHGIYVDDKDNVWISGNAVAPKPGAPGTPWDTNKAGGDGFILKFDMDGNFKMRIGGTPAGPASNDTQGGIDGTPLLYRAADMVVDPRSNRMYIADGYGDRRVLIVDAGTGKYIGHFGAYGSNPVDDAPANSAGPWIEDYAQGKRKPAFFRPPVHCVKVAADGKIYVCDRGNNRVQVFDGNDPALGKACTNPTGTPGKCGYLTEQFIAERTNTSIPGTTISVGFSTDKAQSCLYVGDISNETIYILDRATLHELGRLGNHGRMAGDFHWLHQLATDSAGNIYTSEVDTAKRIQKFVRSAGLGCSGTGNPVVGAARR